MHPVPPRWRAFRSSYRVGCYAPDTKLPSLFPGSYGGSCQRARGRCQKVVACRVSWGQRRNYAPRGTAQEHDKLLGCFRRCRGKYINNGSAGVNLTKRMQIFPSGLLTEEEEEYLVEQYSIQKFKNSKDSCISIFDRTC